MAKINLNELFSEKPQVKYCCAKNCIELSASNPEELYPELDLFVKFLGGEKRVMKWTAIRIIGNLSRVDSKNRIDKYVPEFIGMLDCKELITAANAIAALAEIARSKQKYRDKILAELLKVESKVFLNKGSASSECRNIAIGHVITALAGFTDYIAENKKAVEFLERQSKNTRNAVKLKAEKLLSKVNKVK